MRAALAGKPDSAVVGVAAQSRQGVACGTPLNHRAVWVLGVIGREGGLSNAEIAERVGVRGKSHMSRILMALSALGLVVNLQDDPTPAVPNAWYLTRDGEELERAARDQTPSVAEMRGPRSAPARVSLTVAPPLRPGADTEALRERILAEVVRLTCAEGPGAVNVERVARAARVSPDTLCELFADRDACVRAAFEHGVARARARAGEAVEAADGWLETVRAGLRAVLELFDEEPELARLCVVHSVEAGPLLRADRREVLAALARVVDSEREPARGYPPRLTAEGVVNGALGMVQGQLLAQEHRPLAELLNPLMSFIVLPYLGARAARRELARVDNVEPAPIGLHTALRLLGNESKRRGQPRAKRVLAVLATEPGLSNVALAKRSGVADQGQMSRLLARLERLGLIENHLHAGDLPVASNAWHLTTSGAAVERAICAQTAPTDSAISAAVYETRATTARASVWRPAWPVRRPVRSCASMRLIPAGPSAVPLLR